MFGKQFPTAPAVFVAEATPLPGTTAVTVAVPLAVDVAVPWPIPVVAAPPPQMLGEASNPVRERQ